MAEIADARAEQIQSIRVAIENLEQMRPTRNDPAQHRDAGKLPYKITDYHFALTWRFTELARSALENFEQERLAVAILLTRGAIESAAGLWYAYTKVDVAVRAGITGDLDDAAMRLLLGRRNNPETDALQAISVLTFVDSFDKQMQRAGFEVGFRALYDDLSEVAHPNWEGTLGLYGNINREAIWTDFGPGVRTAVAEVHRGNGLLALSTALKLFEHANSELSDLLPRLRVICAREIRAKRDG